MNYHSELKHFILSICNKNSKNYCNFNLIRNPEDLYKELNIKSSISAFKGELFELFLEELFRGNGYLVDRLGEGGHDEGCDLLVKFPEKGTPVRFVLQAKNWAKAINEFDVRKEYEKFKEFYKDKYKLNSTHFCFVSWSFVKSDKQKLRNKFNIKVWDENDIAVKLIRNYEPRNPKHPNILLEPYQERAFENILQFWNKGEKCYVRHATGTGKTYIIAKLVQVLKETEKNKILIISPSTYINDRILNLLRDYIPVNRIGSKIKDNKQITISTYQSLLYKGKFNIDLKGRFTHVIMDEAHRAGALEWYEKGILNVIGENTKVVGLSATMERYSGGYDIIKFLDGNEAGKLTLFEAMSNGILPLGNYVYSVIDIKSTIDNLTDEINSKYKRSKRKRDELLKKFKTQNIKYYSIEKIIEKHYSGLKFKKILAFCENIEHTDEIHMLLRRTFRKFSKIELMTINSKDYTKKENERTLNDFSNGESSAKKIFILTAIDMLNEGIDVSGIDSVMLFRRTGSPRIYFQQIGRCLRRHGVESPLIFDCVLNYKNIDIDFKQEIKKSNFGWDKNELDEKLFEVFDETADISKIINEVETRLNFYPTYEEAKEAVMKLNIQTMNEYRIRYIEDPRLPSTPNRTYENKGWISWYDYFGKSEPIEPYEIYEEAKSAVKSLNIQTIDEYELRYNEDPRLPSHPDRTYSNKGWIDWYHFLDKERPDYYNTYEEAKSAVQKLKINSFKEYMEKFHLNPLLPSNPQRFYKNKGWIDWYDFIGKDKPKYYETFKEAKNLVLKLNLNSKKDYYVILDSYPKLPYSPDQVYKGKGWTDWFDFLGLEKKNYYKTCEEAKIAVLKLKISSSSEYKTKYKEDIYLPSQPWIQYKDKGWKDWYDFLGKDRPEYYHTYKEAKNAITNMNINSYTDYTKKKKYQLDPKLPPNPERFYKDKGWTNWYDFLGKEKPEYYLTYEEAHNAVLNLKIKNQNEYQVRHNEDKKLPDAPWSVYKNRGW
ncbi:MAG: integrase repeat-containing protein, partial [bacterium]|nr:integrase repeat-containing protein [bacterium]